MTIADDGAQLTEHGSDHEPLDDGGRRDGPAAALSAWVRALSPQLEFDGLQFSGNQELTSLVLQTLSPAELRADEAVVQLAAS